MTRQLVRLMWNRKRQSALLMIEIFCTFLVVVVVSVGVLDFLHNVRQPLGFDIRDVWVLDVSPGKLTDVKNSTDQERQQWQEVLQTIRDQSDVVAAAVTFSAPYGRYGWGQDLRLPDGGRIGYSANQASDDFANAVGLSLLGGRWFSKEDDGASWAPVVVDASFAKEVFGTTDVVGRTIEERPQPGAGRDRDNPEKRIVGVITAFRQHGEYSQPDPYLFFRADFGRSGGPIGFPNMAVIRVRPGTTAAFEEKLVKRLEAVEPDWSFNLGPEETLRASTLRLYLIPLSLAAIVAGFLLLMVAFGLTGVLWQTVTERTQEFGLRRAVGATVAGVGRQVSAELLITTSFAVLAGCVLLAQIPLLPLPDDVRSLVPRSVMIFGVLLAVALVGLVAVICSLYPSWLATRVPPAEALHYE